VGNRPGQAHRHRQAAGPEACESWPQRFCQYRQPPSTLTGPFQCRSTNLRWLGCRRNTSTASPAAPRHGFEHSSSADFTMGGSGPGSRGSAELWATSLVLVRCGPAFAARSFLNHRLRSAASARRMRPSTQSWGSHIDSAVARAAFHFSNGPCNGWQESFCTRAPSSRRCLQVRKRPVCPLAVSRSCGWRHWQARGRCVVGSELGREAGAGLAQRFCFRPPPFRLPPHHHLQSTGDAVDVDRFGDGAHWRGVVVLIDPEQDIVLPCSGALTCQRMFLIKNTQGADHRILPNPSMRCSSSPRTAGIVAELLEMKVQPYCALSRAAC